MLRRTLLQVELLNTGLIGSDGGTLDTDTILLDGLSGINGDLVVGLVTVFNALSRKVSLSVLIWTVGGGPPYQVVVLEVNVEVPSI